MSPKRLCGATVALAAVLCLTGCGLFGHKAKPAGPGQGKYHKIHEGDSLVALSQEYGVPVEAIARANNLSNPALLYEGLVLWIPPRDEAGPSAGFNPSPGGNPLGKNAAPGGAGTSQLPRPPEAQGSRGFSFGPDASAPRPMNGGQSSSNSSESLDSAPPSAAPASDAGALGFRWPIQSGRFKIARRFSSGNGDPNRGLDLQAKRGTAVLASRDGVVISSGSDLRGFGNMIVLDHEDGFTTIYAHNDKNLVVKGQRVRRGETIARVGATDTNSPKLHFEIRKGSSAVPIDPLSYLPQEKR